MKIEQCWNKRTFMNYVRFNHQGLNNSFSWNTTKIRKIKAFDNRTEVVTTAGFARVNSAIVASSEISSLISDSTETFEESNRSKLD